jgi:adenylate cyclase
LEEAMTTSSQHRPDRGQPDIIIDVLSQDVSDPSSSDSSLAPEVVESVIVETAVAQVSGGGSATVIVDSPPELTQEQQVLASTGGALATTKGSFSTFLAPLKKDTFRQVVTDVEQKLQVVNQTLSMLDMQGFDAILEEMLSSITFKTSELLAADRVTIFLLDDEKNELYSIIAKGEGGGTLEIRIPADKGIAGEVATERRVVNIPFDFFDDPRSTQAKIQYEKTGYRTYTMLAMPLLDEEGNLVAVVQMMNKLKPETDPALSLDQRIDLQGFTTEDEQVFREFAPSIRLILESSRSFYKATQQQRAAQALMQATKALSESSLDLEETLSKVMDEAKKLMQADRSTLWLLDEERGELWTKIPINGVLQELRIPKDAGFAGQVATTGEPLLIPFDLYEHPNAETAKEVDGRTGYRTCSMLCMPVFNAGGTLIGVTQLVNKIKQGEFPPYNPENFPEAPDCWKASFNRNDQEFMKAFNIQAGVALQNAKLFATVKQQEQMQRDILRSLSNGVISTDKQGNIIAANESAKKLLGLDVQEPIEGRSVSDLITLEKGDFSKWIVTALEAKGDKSRQQYYPDQTLNSLIGDEQHSINLSINTIADAADPTKVSGALVVMDDISDEKRLKSTMYRYMTQELAEQLMENPDAARMGGDRKEVSVLFSDIRSYTTITESLSAEEVVEMLNEYFEAMVDAVFTYKGTLDKYIGDAIMAVFGSPLPLDDHEWMSVQTALEMRKRLVAFNDKRATEGYKPIYIGIGINSDTVISGNIGSSKRMEFTAIGDGVNLGSRLESASKLYGTDIVISETTYRPCADRIWARELDYIKVKGKNKPVAVYELVGLRSDPVSDQKQEVIEHYLKGRESYLNRKFAIAMGEFARALEVDSSDKSSALHLERCQHWLQQPPPDDWDGSWTLTQK